MKLVQRLLSASPDLLAAKRYVAESHLLASVSGAHCGWLAPARSSELAQVAGDQLHAVGIGRKIVEGKLTSTPCVRLYVARKLPRHLLASKAQLPDRIDGIPTDVVEAAPAYLAAATPCSLRKLREQRPAQGGVSGAHESTLAGTLAARCRSTRGDEAGARFVLGNCHTFADFGRAANGSAVLQPSTIDGGTEGSQLAGLHRFAPIDERAEASNQVDAAIARLESADAMAPGICSVGQIQGLADAVFEDRVHKHGRTTGYTSGFVDDPSIDVLIPLYREQPGRLTRFVNQIRIRPLSGQFVVAQPGDSGALVLTKQGNLAIGLIFACPDNGSFAYANPIQAVVDTLEIEFD